MKKVLFICLLLAISICGFGYASETTDFMNGIKIADFFMYDAATGNSYTQTAQPQRDVQYTMNNNQLRNNDNVVAEKRETPKTLGDLPAGTFIMDSTSVWNRRLHDNYTGDIEVSMPVIWRKLEDNHYTKGATLLLSEEQIAKYPYCHRQKGLRDWGESDVRRFLRTTFYNHLSQEFKNAIVNVNVPYADMQGKPKTIVDNFFLLSIVEWGLSDRKNNGTVIKYNDLPAIYVGREILFQKADNKPGLYGGKSEQYTRTINKPEATSAGYSNEVFVIRPGYLGTVSAGYGTPIRPAVNLKSSTPVKGPLEYNFAFGKKIEYYALDFGGSQKQAPVQSLSPVK